MTLEDVKGFPDGLNRTYEEAFKRLLFQKKVRNPFTGKNENVDAITPDLALLLQLLMAFQEPPTLEDIAWAAEGANFSSERLAFWGMGMSTLDSLFPRSIVKEDKGRSIYSPFHKSVIDYLVADQDDDRDPYYALYLASVKKGPVKMDATTVVAPFNMAEQGGSAFLSAVKPSCLLVEVTRKRAKGHEAIAARSLSVLNDVKDVKDKVKDKHTLVVPLIERWHICRHALIHASLAGAEAMCKFAPNLCDLFFIRAQLEEGSNGLARLLRGLQNCKEVLQDAARLPTGNEELRNIMKDFEDMQRFLRANAPQLCNHPEQLFTEALNSPPCRVVKQAIERLGKEFLRGSWELVESDRPLGFPFRMATLVGHERRISCIAFSPDGRKIASGSDDHTIKLFDVVTGEVIRTLKGHTQGVTCLAFLPNGIGVASGSSDGTLILWDASTGDNITTWDASTSKIILCDSELLASLKREVSPHI